jgi:hypothetical protein
MQTAPHAPAAPRTLTWIEALLLALAALAICAYLPPPVKAQAKSAKLATGAQSIKLKVAFQPDRAGARTTIRFGFRISGPNGMPPSPIVSLALRMPEHMGLITTTLGQATCYPHPLLQDGLAGCSENARLGFGDAVAVVPLRNHPIYERASLTALLGPPATNHIQVLFYAEGLTPVFAQFVFPGVLVGDVHPFGDRIDTTIPLVAPWPNGPNIALMSFSSTIGPLHLTYHRQVNGKRIAYRPHGLMIPKHCPPGGFPFAALLTFEDTTTTEAIAHVPCPRS